MALFSLRMGKENVVDLIIWCKCRRRKCGVGHRVLLNFRKRGWKMVLLCKFSVEVCLGGFEIETLYWMYKRVYCIWQVSISLTIKGCVDRKWKTFDSHVEYNSFSQHSDILVLSLLLVQLWLFELFPWSSTSLFILYIKYIQFRLASLSLPADRRAGQLAKFGKPEEFTGLLSDSVEG